MAQASRTLLSRVIFGAAAVTLTLGAVQLASGRDLSGISQEPAALAADGNGYSAPPYTGAPYAAAPTPAAPVQESTAIVPAHDDYRNDPNGGQQ